MKLKILFILILAFTVNHFVNAQSGVANGVYEKTKSSIAFVYVYDVNRNLIRIGSGFTYTPDGQIVTAYSLTEGGYYIKIKVNDIEFSPTVIYKLDRRRDIIVYKVDGFNLPYLGIGNSDNISIGQEVYVAGNPKGYEKSLLESFVSGKRDIGAGKIYFQLTEGSGCGLVGSPVLNRNSEVVGIFTSKLFPADNVNFATQINTVKRLLESTNVKNYPVPNFFDYEQTKTNYDMGLYYERRGDHSTALWYYIRSLQDRVTAETYRRIAYCYEQLKNIQAAKEYYRLAREFEAAESKLNDW